MDGEVRLRNGEGNGISVVKVVRVMFSPKKPAIINSTPLTIEWEKNNTAFGDKIKTLSKITEDQKRTLWIYP